MYKMVLLSLMLLPENVLVLLVELLTWNLCFVLRRNAQIYSWYEYFPTTTAAVTTPSFE